jgi:hypothetical protein
VLVSQVPPASEQDRRGAGPVLAEASQQCPAWRVGWADGGDSGPLVAGAAPTGCQVVIVAKPPARKLFTALPRRWVVARTVAWLSRYRRRSNPIVSSLAAITTSFISS